MINVTTDHKTRSPIKTPGLPKKMAEPSHSPSSATYIGLRVNRYGPRIIRKEGVSPRLTLVGVWGIAEAKIHMRRAAASAITIRPTRFQIPGDPSAHPYRGRSVERAHGTTTCASGI